MLEEHTEVQDTSSRYTVLFFIAFSIIGWFACTCLFEESWGLRLFSVFAAFDGLCLLHAKVRHISVAKRCYAYLAVPLLLILSLTFFENELLVLLILMTSALITLYWLPMIFGKCHSNVLEPSAISDSARTFFFIPIQHIKETFNQLTTTFKGSSILRRLLLGFLASIPVLAIAICLLQEVDYEFLGVTQNFEKLMGQIFDRVPQFVLSLFIGFYLLSMTHGTSSDKYEITKFKSPRSADTVISSVVVTLLCGLYLLFIPAQIGSVVDAFGATKFSASFYSSFARRGFTELCLVALLNFTVAAFIQRRDTIKPLITKILLSLLGFFTLCLISLAFSKMYLYISIYSFTVKRIYTCCFMLVLAIIFVMLIIAQWKDLPLFKLSAILLVLSLLVLSYSNMSGFVAQSNIDNYLSGKDTNLPSHTHFPAPAVPVYCNAFDSIEDEDIKHSIQNDLKWMATSDVSEGDPTLWSHSLQAVQAFHIVQEFMIEHPDMTD